MTYLALDLGSRRIGIAVGNTEVRLATPLRVIERTTPGEDAVRLRRLAEEYGADELIVGFPREVDGSVGPQAEWVANYAEQLRQVLDMPIQFSDERYSTAEALARRRAAGMKDKQGRATIDAVAAAVILQDFLDHRG